MTKSTDKHPAVIDQADLISILKWVEEDLRNAVYAIINSFEILPEADIRGDREILHSTGLLAARRLEYTHQKITNLARIVSDDFGVDRVDRSTQSITREAILFAIAQDGRFGEIEYQPKMSDTDAIVRIDPECTIHLLASLLLSVSARCAEGRVRLSMSHTDNQGSTTVAWHISSEECPTEVDWDQVLEAGTMPERSEGEAAIHDKYWHALSRVIGATVELSDVPRGIVVKMTAPLVRFVQVPPHAPRRPWIDAPALLAGPEPSCFTPINASVVPLANREELQPLIEEVSPGILVLNQPADDESSTRLNIALSQMCDLPVLLRAEHLTYEQLNRYRKHVDAIVMEPSEAGMLARYVTGLSSLDRRGRRRVAEIH